MILDITSFIHRIKLCLQTKKQDSIGLDVLFLVSHKPNMGMNRGQYLELFILAESMLLTSVENAAYRSKL